MATIIVRRGLGTFYYQSLVAFARSRNLHVVLDRRTGERRSATQQVAGERRRGDRRGAPPSTWDQADYIVVPDGDDPQTRP